MSRKVVQELELQKRFCLASAFSAKPFIIRVSLRRQFLSLGYGQQIQAMIVFSLDGSIDHRKTAASEEFKCRFKFATTMWIKLYEFSRKSSKEKVSSGKSSYGSISKSRPKSVQEKDPRQFDEQENWHARKL